MPCLPAAHRQADSSPSWTLLWLALAALCCAAPLASQTSSFTSFDAPDAGSLSNQGTFPVKINPSGVIAGYYLDSGYNAHGFVRTATGVITEFDATGLTGTVVSAINRRGRIVGTGFHFTARGDTVHGYLRFPTGQFVQINPPAAAATFPDAINDKGEIAGTYIDPISTADHGFLRDDQGNYTVVDDPDAVTGKLNAGTIVTAIHTNGSIAGYFDTNAATVRGFVRDQFGNFTNFDAPDAGTCPGCGTFPLAMNEVGEITGFYRDNSSTLHGFLRDSQGAITEFSVPGALSTVAASTNNSGKTTGQWTTSQNIARGFIRDSSGSITSFSVPLRNFGTTPNDINDALQITGFYIDSDAVSHGFLQ